jgi:hypothetical protein
VAVHPVSQQELIPGYVTLERLGAGGYGEVWKVEAPGGLHKAIKVVYGLLDEDRAARELKALHHVKEVRHPFLLSLERIEVVDGRLMIVTELADGSLMDRFELCRSQGAVGIERDEMLGYLRDAADALDYMLQQCSLQHLDVKPENLLLVAGRTKVADFGLVKELADKTRSLVGAMTPTYAAPELFEGKASRQSDQYSLAIVYQEMLTGVLPFPGRSAAQLASQHQRNRPQLSALPAHDRDIIARALSKKPEDRFGSCRELAEALATAGKLVARVDDGAATSDTRSLRAEDTATPKGGGRKTPAGHGLPDRTEVFAGGKPPSGGSKTPRHITVVRENLPPVVQVSTRICDIPPPEVDRDKIGARPTLLLGIGGTGLLAVARLRERLISEYGDAVVREAFPLLVVDTDPASMKRAVALGLDTQDLLMAPLRASHEYRNDAEVLLKWLGRRWLFNIPKSCLTEGFRPLGRLALVDHAAQLVTRLRQRLTRVCGDSAVRLLTGQTGKKPRSEVPRVCLIGASSGGTGGGMLLEMAYAVNNVARQQDQRIETCAFISHGTPQNAMQSQLALANTAALLRELQHYVRQGAAGAASDPRATLFDGEDFPFASTYFFQLGDELSTAQYHRRVEQLADYLFCDTTSPLGALLDRCRAETQGDEDSFVDYRLRSFELRRFTAIDDEQVAHTERLLAAEIVKLWIQEIAIDPRAQQSDSEAQAEPAHDGNAAVESEKNARPQVIEYSPMYLMNSSELAAQILGLAPSAPLAREAAVVPAARVEPAEPEVQERKSAPVGPTTCTIWKGVQALRELAGNQWSGQLTAEQIEALEVDLLKQLQSAKSEYVSMRNYYDETPREITSRAHKLAETLLVEFLESLRRKLYSPSAKLLPLVEMLASVVHYEAPKLISQNSSAVPSELLKYCQERPDRLHDWGCQRRLALLGPANSELASLGTVFPQQEVYVAHSTDENFWVCEEFADLSLAHLVTTLTHGKPEVQEATARLHARGDIDWTTPAEVEIRESHAVSV